MRGSGSYGGGAIRDYRPVPAPRSALCNGAGVTASAVLGIACGYLLCSALGLIDFTQVREAPSSRFLAAVSSVRAFRHRHRCHVHRLSRDHCRDHRNIHGPGKRQRRRRSAASALASGMLCDGVGSRLFAAVMSSSPVSTFAQNVGVVSPTGVASRHGDADRRDAAAGRPRSRCWVRWW